MVYNGLVGKRSNFNLMEWNSAFLNTSNGVPFNAARFNSEYNPQGDAIISYTVTVGFINKKFPKFTV